MSMGMGIEGIEEAAMKVALKAINIGPMNESRFWKAYAQEYKRIWNRVWEEDARRMEADPNSPYYAGKK